MGATNIYLTFENQAEEAFLFYKNIFGGEFSNGGMKRFKDMPPNNEAPIAKKDEDLVMHVELEILGGTILMGCDIPKSSGFDEVKIGNNVQISLATDNKAQTEKLFNGFSEGGKITMPLQDTFWGAYFGSCIDKFGITWMVNFQKEMPV